MSRAESSDGVPDRGNGEGRGGKRKGKKGKGKPGKGKKKKGKRGKATKGGRRKEDEVRGGEGTTQGGDEAVGAAVGAKQEAEEGKEEDANVGEEEEEPTECAICLLDLQEDDDDQEEATVLACGHPFHSACVTLWVNNCRSKSLDATCPICRAAIMY